MPGDLGAIVRMHGLLYAAEYGLDASFEASVAARLAELSARGWPGEGEGVWIAAAAGAEPVGSITLSDEGAGLARLGHFLLLPPARGQGLGLRLVDTVLSRARASGYSRIELITFSELTSAARIYRAAGFTRDTSERRALWGRELDLERYELAL
jgi:RimJ/RimL family protein N-acetyltransferase